MNYMKRFFLCASILFCGLSASSQETGSSDVTYGGKSLSEAANGHEYVDLGLPSGTLWATMNIGAIKPAGYGDYFAWGELSGYNDGKETFSWKNYKLCNGSQSKITKYMVDRKKAREIALVTDQSLADANISDVELDIEDDVARAQWGGSWRIPTSAAFRELNKECEREWTTQNGRWGYLFTSKTNGNSIFFPAGGFRDKTLYNLAAYGYYWSRTLYTRYSGGAFILYFDSNGVNAADNQYRCMGRSVRAVLER